MTVDLGAMIDQLAWFGEALPPVVRCAGEEGVRWKPDTRHWSIVEIVNHLADEEVEDFRTRTFQTLEHPEEAWPPIDPEGVVIERKHQEKDLEESLERFVELRKESVGMLRMLLNPQWDNAHEHPSIGTMRAGDVFASWVAHDALHLRQVAKRLYQLSEMRGDPYSVDYAGGW
ncbi:MAG: DinB family protein [Phycisphaerales bacterium JB043]